MPRQGGQGKGKPKLKDRDFGKALIKRHAQGAQGMNGLKTKQGTNMVSILDNSALDDFINTTEMDGTDAEVLRVHKSDAFLVEPTVHKALQKMSLDQFKYQHLVIPRKPKWNRNMTAEEVDLNEKRSFLQWRRDIAGLENENSNKVTPFEKNIEVWRQLWRVVERSDIVVQIVDARNPLLYFTNDLAVYTKEQTPPRPMILLVNKADYLTEYQRICWGRYLDSRGIKYIYYSAVLEQAKLDHNQPDSVSAEEVEADMDDLVKHLLEHWGTGEAKEAASATSGEPHNEFVWGGNDDEDAGDSAGEEEGSAGAEEEEEDGEDDEDSAEGMTQKKNKFALAEDEESSETNDENRGGDKDSASGDDSEDEASDSAGDHEEEGEAEEEEVESSAPPAVKEPSSKPQVRAAATAVPVGGSGLESFRVQILTRTSLQVFMGLLAKNLNITAQPKHNGRICVGMVGYPNVGKSSVINTLLGVSKSAHGVARVGVSSTPGKTKHFQTLMLTDTLMLCDCPGLVFPSFMNSTGEMLCAGILPINQMRDYVDPAAVMASRVPKHLLEAAYGMRIRKELDIMDDPNRPPTAHEMLCAYCEVKGYITNGTGRWDEFRACKELLRDFNDGRILYVACPENVTDMAKWLQETEKTMVRQERVAERVAVQKLKESTAPSQESEMVFGDFRAERKQAAVAERVGSEFKEAVHYDDESEEEEEEDLQTQETSDQSAAKREHKRLKHWGKKNRKLRDKNPYGDENGVVSYVAYTTNRGHFQGADGKAAVGEKKQKVKRQDPRHGYGTSYVRASMPHHHAEDVPV